MSDNSVTLGVLNVSVAPKQLESALDRLCKEVDRLERRILELETLNNVSL